MIPVVVNGQRVATRMVGGKMNAVLLNTLHPVGEEIVLTPADLRKMADGLEYLDDFARPVPTTKFSRLRALDPPAPEVFAVDVQYPSRYDIDDQVDSIMQVSSASSGTDMDTGMRELTYEFDRQGDAQFALDRLKASFLKPKLAATKLRPIVVGD